MSKYEIAALAFLVSSSLIALFPVKILLRFDRRSGYEIYKRTLRLTGSEEKALKDAEDFYRLFGCAFAVCGLLLGFIYQRSSH
jgi:hypothetical protein